MTTADDLDQARHHPIWADLEALNQRLDAAKPRSTTDRETISRVASVVSYALRFRKSNVRLLPRDRLSAMGRLQSYASQITNLIEGWDQSGAMNSSTISQLDRHADDILDELNRWPALPRAERESANAYADESERKASNAALETLLQDVEQARLELESLQASLDSLRTQSMEAIAGTLSATEDMREQLNAEVRASEETREKAAIDVADEAEVQRKEIESKAELQMAVMKANAQEILDQLESDKADASKLLAFVSDGAISGGYGKYAKSEIVAYRLWNILGALTALGGIGYLIWHFNDISGLDVQVVITRAALSVPIFGISAYAFRRANLRHKNAEDATYRALDLLALPPFVDGMSTEEQSQLRMLMGQRIFSGTPSSNEVDKMQESDVLITPETFATIQGFLKNLQSLIK